IHCSSDASCVETATCTLAEGGADTGSTNAEVPPGCDENADAKDSLPCAVDSFAVFVDANGDDANEGTRARPGKTIMAGLAMARMGARRKNRLYICGAGPYAEHVKLTATASAHLFGGFACGSWTYDGTKARIAPGDPGYALSVDRTAASLRVSDL